MRSATAPRSCLGTVGLTCLNRKIVECMVSLRRRGMSFTIDAGRRTCKLSAATSLERAVLNLPHAAGLSAFCQAASCRIIWLRSPCQRFFVRIPDIELTEREIEILSQIKFRFTRHEELRSSIMPMAALWNSLYQRSAIPEVRLQYFTDPERNPGGRGKSRMQIFEKNGTTGDEIFSHPHFLKYLEYFIYGPDLPREVITTFNDAKQFSGYLTHGDIDDLVPDARAFVKLAKRNPIDAADEFHKLALECFAQPSGAESMRKLIRAVR